jgi:hypothetical protein
MIHFTEPSTIPVPVTIIKIITTISPVSIALPLITIFGFIIFETFIIRSRSHNFVLSIYGKRQHQTDERNKNDESNQKAGNKFRHMIALPGIG